MDGSIYGGLLIGGEQNTSDRNVGNRGITARLAVTPEILRDAWVLRHDAYSSQGFIDPHPSGMFMDECDRFPSSRVVVLYKDHVPVGTVRVCLYAPESNIEGADFIPAMDAFGNEIKDLLARSSLPGEAPRAVEVMRLATHPDLGADPEPAMALFLMAGYLTMHFRANAAFCAVRRHHMPLYRRFGWEKVTEPRPYPKLKFQTGLMASVQSDPYELRQSMPIMHPISLEDEIYWDFIAGHPVQVFDETRSATKISRMLLERAGKSPRTPVLQPAFASSVGAHQELALAA